MATIAQQPDEENQQNPAGGPITVSNTGGGAPSGKSLGAPGQSQVQQNAAPQPASQGYTDVASYLNANQNQQGAAQLGQTVSQNLTDRYNQTKGGIDSSVNQFTGAVNQGYTPENTQLINQVASNPTAAAADPSQTAAFQGQLNDSYTGPTSWADQGTQQGKVNDANQYASLATTPGGLNVYAQQAEGQNGGSQSQGINQLDTLLLGGNSGAVQNIRSAADPYKTLNDYINSQNTAGLGAVSTAQNNATNASQDALNAFTGANGTLTNLNNTINKTAADQLSQAQQTQASVKADLASGNLTPQDMQALGINPQQADDLYRAIRAAGTSQYMTGHNFGAASETQQINPLDALQQADPTQLINAGTVATPEQYSQMSAIQKLLGGKTPQGGAINPALASLAGTYNPSQLNQFNASGITSYAQQVADAERAAAQDKANQLTAVADAAHASSKSGGFFGNLPGPLQSGLKYLANPMLAIPDEQKLLGTKP